MNDGLKQFVHENDYWLVSDDDFARLFQAGRDTIDSMMEQDNVFRTAAYLTLRDEGIESGEAARRIHKRFPTYYLDPSNRDMPEMQSDEDAKIPLAVKMRLREDDLAAVTKILESSQLNTFNAAIRMWVRSARHT